MSSTLKENPFKLATNEALVYQVLEELAKVGVQDIIVCPGGRNTPFIIALEKMKFFKQYFWPEERSGAFFALGRSKLTRRPVAVIVTSGTAAGELLPAAMEAYYTGIPLILITADRPRRYRGTGSPQAAEQVGLFGQYAVYELDLANDELCNLKEWDQCGVAHLNICIEEPLSESFKNTLDIDHNSTYSICKKDNTYATQISLDQFIQKSRCPFVVVSNISMMAKEPLVRFLIQYNAPVYLEASSGLREDVRLSHLKIYQTENIWKAASNAGYKIDGILRIGGVPTIRLWRDLEDKRGEIEVCSINDLPFSGLSWGTINNTCLETFFRSYQYLDANNISCKNWIDADRHYVNKVLQLLNEEPESEAALVHQLSKQIPSKSQIFLGNSLPIREWDAYADFSDKNIHVFTNRGLNGIDGQISTFLGICSPKNQNWGIFGDLTTLYDLAGPWILEQMKEIDLNLVVINNGGGKIFAKMFSQRQIQNLHSIQFKPLADFWSMHYERYTQIPKQLSYGGHRLIEIIPNEEATLRFWKKIGELQ